MRLKFESGEIEVSDSNPYMLAGRDWFFSLYEIVRDNPDGYAIVLSHSRRDVGKRLDSELTAVLHEYRKDRPDYVIPTRNKLWLVFHGIDRPLKCPVCGKTVFKKVLHITQEYEPYCCMKCAGASDVPKAKQLATKESRYGDPLFNNRDKFRETVESMPEERRKAWRENILKAFRERFGADSYMETGEFRRKAKEWVRQTYGDEYDNVLQVPEVRARNEELRLEEYGHPQWSNWEKGRETCFEHYGVDVIFKSEEFKTKRRETCVREYRVPFAPANRYEHNGTFYDSKPEFAFAVWAADNGMAISRNTETSFTYEFKGKPHSYWPDFIVDGKPVEIKGDQFFRPDGTMFCPYRKDGSTDDEYADLCGLYEAKHQCMLANDVRIIRTSEYEEYIDYVEKTYGFDFFKRHMKTKIDTGK